MGPWSTWMILQGRLLQQGCDVAARSLLQLLLCSLTALSVLGLCFRHGFVLIRLLQHDASLLPACCSLLPAALQHLHHTIYSRTPHRVHTGASMSFCQEMHVCSFPSTVLQTKKILCKDLMMRPAS